jgi:hypothetical protein
MCDVNKHVRYPIVKTSLCLFIFMLGTSLLYAQDGEKGIQAATDLVKRYFTTAQTLLYAIGGVVGIVGAVKVYNKWSHGDQDTSKTAASWFGACIFLVVVATVLKAFFNLN